jgi:apolipoprotein D and lipocalin family protein
VYFSRFFGAPYFILDLDEDYKWVLVGEPSRSYLWVLSRTEEMNPELLEQLKQKAKDYGYDISKLIYRNETN